MLFRSEDVTNTIQLKAILQMCFVYSAMLIIAWICLIFMYLFAYLL